MIYINILPDSERSTQQASSADVLIGGKKPFDWFFWAPWILGGVLAVLLIVTLLFFFLPNLKLVKENDTLAHKWKKLEPDYNDLLARDQEGTEYLAVLDEFYRFIDERLIWSRVMQILAKNLPRDIQFKRMTAESEMKKIDVIQKITVEDERGRKKIIEKMAIENKLVHVVRISGLVPIDSQAKVISFKKSLEKDEFLKKVIGSISIPSITATSQSYKSFTLEIFLNSIKANRE